MVQGAGKLAQGSTVPSGHPSPPSPPSTPATLGQLSTPFKNPSPSQSKVFQFGLSVSHLFLVPSSSQSDSGSVWSQTGGVVTGHPVSSTSTPAGVPGQVSLESGMPYHHCLYQVRHHHRNQILNGDNLYHLHPQNYL